jgi:hypothetical protein
MKKTLFLVSSFCFLAVTGAMAQQTEVKTTKEIKSVETNVAQPTEKETRAPKSEVKIVPSKKVVKARKLDATRQVKASKVQTAVVPARNREEEK